LYNNFGYVLVLICISIIFITNLKTCILWIDMNIIIDTDPAMGTLGIGSQDPEDGFAIMLALRSPEVNVKAITVVHGNVPVVNSYSNVVHLLKLLDRIDIPVAPGLTEPFMKRPQYKHFPKSKTKGTQIAPLQDIKKAPLHAVDLIINTVMKSIDPITIVAIGPLSNIAAALLREPRLAKKTERVVIMGGALKTSGNITPVAEYNIWADPYAASIVFKSRIPITVVGLDVCHQTLVVPHEIKSLGKSPLAQFVREATMPWFSFVKKAGREGFHLYDSLALAVSFLPGLVKMEPAWVEVETTSPLTAGQTVAWFDHLREVWIGDKSNCLACTQLVDNKRFSDLFNERVLDPLRK